METLHCNDGINVSRVIESQTELRILGIYGNAISRNLLKTLQQFQNAQLFLPMVVMLRESWNSLSFDSISIFPAFYSVDRSATIYQQLAKSFDGDQGFNMRANADQVIQLSIYLVDSSDIRTICTLAKNMAATFPLVYWLNFVFECQCEIVSS